MTEWEYDKLARELQGNLRKWAPMCSWYVSGSLDMLNLLESMKISSCGEFGGKEFALTLWIDTRQVITMPDKWIRQHLASVWGQFVGKLIFGLIEHD